MKTIFLMLILTLNITANANEDLSQVMKTIKSEIRVVFGAIQSGAITEQTLISATNMSMAIELASALTPDAIEQLPEEVKTAQLLRYKGLIHQLLGFSLELEFALIIGDLDLAKSSISSMGDLQKKGHNLFN